MSAFYEAPIFFEPNRVYRVYLGGKLFSEFFGDDSQDGNYPEEWVASSVKAINAVDGGPYEGISKIAGCDLHLNEAFAQYPAEMLGGQKDFGVLVKLLDSAIRLPMQAHPDKAFSREHFHSPYGKAESWVILATRPGAKLYFGFQEGVTLEAFQQAIDESETNRDAMTALVHEVPVKPGDVFFIPAKAVHAIGPGCLILETQEPTDFTIQPEHWCGEQKLSDYEMYLGLPRDTAVECFDFDTDYDGRVAPQAVLQEKGLLVERLIGPQQTDCFRVDRARLSAGTFRLPQAPAVYVVTEGEGRLCGNGSQRPVRKGDYFFLPYAARDHYSLTGGDLEVILCYR